MAAGDRMMWKTVLPDVRKAREKLRSTMIYKVRFGVNHANRGPLNVMSYMRINILLDLKHQTR